MRCSLIFIAILAASSCNDNEERHAHQIAENAGDAAAAGIVEMAASLRLEHGINFELVGARYGNADMGYIDVKDKVDAFIRTSHSLVVDYKIFSPAKKIEGELIVAVIQRNEILIRKFPYGTTASIK